MNSSPWWISTSFPSLIILFNLGLWILIIGGFIFLLIKVASMDRTLKEILKKLDNRW